MINLNDLKGHSALSLLERYDGINPYLRRLRNEYIKNNKILLTENQSKYIIENHDREPQLIQRVIAITNYLGLELQKQDGVSFTPEKVLVEFILAETDRAFHVYGKLKQNQAESRMYWLPKTQIIGDIFFETVNIEVDFIKYNDILSNNDRKLYNYQEDGVKFLLSRPRSILGDQMGLGKSLQSIVAALESGSQKILIVCPASLKLNWKKEIEFFTKDVCIIDGNKWKTAKFTIINYDILKNFHSISNRDTNETHRELVNEKFDLIIADEAHYLKSPDAIRSKIINELTLKFNIEMKVWLLTGSPISNKVMDFYNLLKIIKAPVADNWMFYARRFCDGKKFFRTLKNGSRKQIWLTNGATNLVELSNHTKNYIFRRLSTEVLDLPEKTIIPVYQELSKNSRKKYLELWENYLIKREEDGKSCNINRDLTELILLRKFIAMEAIPQTIELVENALEEGQKVIIFTCFTEELLALQTHFGKACVIHYGPMTNKQKQKSVDEFQRNDKITVFIGNIVSAGVGLTLTSSNITVFNSFQWSPGENDQAEYRNYRIGQKNNVSIYYQLFIDTISIRIWEMLKDKKISISTILNENELISEILKLPSI